MSTERRVYVRMPETSGEHVLDLASRALAALTRSKKLLPGDRTEVVRFEALHAAIDQMAIAALVNGALHDEVVGGLHEQPRPGPSVMGPGFSAPPMASERVTRWIDEGAVVVELRLPHFPGPTSVSGTPGVGPPQPAARWTSSQQRPRDAVQERFLYLLNASVREVTDASGRAYICPSGIPNRVLTESLREYVVAVPGSSRVDVPIVYRDGSHGHCFPLRSLQLSESVPEHWRVLRFTLISIRHVEMDAVVDGAWLRNTKISRPRAAGLTDDIVFDSSMSQLRLLASQEPTVILMYQTGLETAIVGFYRAVVHQLLLSPGSVCVVPFYYQAAGSFVEGQAWATK